MPNKAHVLVFTSGKGGVGKTCITTNVAAAMVRRGARVCIFDADTGLANINILLGLRPQFTLEHVLRGEKTIREIIVTTEEGISVVPGASGIVECANIRMQEAKRLIGALAELEAVYDYILIDTAAGIAESVLQFVESAPDAFLIITSEPTSLTDAFSLLKLLNGADYYGRLRVVVNMAADHADATETYRRFEKVVEKYLQIGVEYGGFVVRDENVPRSIALQSPLIELSGNTPAGRCLYMLGDGILNDLGAERPEAGLADYWSHLLAEREATTGDGGGDLEAPAAEDASGARGQAPVEMSVEELSRKLLAAMKEQSAEREPLDDFVSRFVSVYQEQHGGFPQSFKPLFYRWLESENYAAPRLMELISTLESLYVSRYQQPLFSLEDSAARLVAQTRSTESQLRGVIDQLCAAYRQSYQADVFDAQQEILKLIRRDDFTEERFEELLQAQREAFRTRFNRPYQGQSELLLESTAEALAAMATNEQDLQEEVAMMAKSFQQLTSRRDALLKAIKTAQGNNRFPIKSKTSVNG